MRTILLGLARKLWTLLGVLWVVVTAVFLLIHLVPGDPVALMLGEGATAADVNQLRHQMGLDLPVYTQYLRYWAGVLHGDLGESLRLHDAVTRLIGQRYVYTLLLTVCATLLAALLAVPAGVVCARRRGSWLDRMIGVGSLFGLSLPNFAIGPVLIVALAIGLGWFPVSGAGDTPASLALHLVLPSLTLALGLAAVLTRMVRASVSEELAQDYIRTARAKGLSEARVVYRHALRNALNPVVTVLGLQFGGLLAGAIVTETIFSWPGIGRLTLTAISNRDYPLVQGCILTVGLTYVAVNLLTDAVQVALDPRMRAAR